uniref:Uncharacterized protein n=1 Tax=Ananas comosus var. bracteatus TaxID=296719 RepID=A0A6V7NF22_ANACO|nr:unnamed protein product [Ananas comosus var. bracteatus]
MVEAGSQIRSPSLISQVEGGGEREWEEEDDSHIEKIVWSPPTYTINVETIRRVTSQGRSDEDWAIFHAAHIERLGQRLQAIFDQLPIAGDDPIQATSIYM